MKKLILVAGATGKLGQKICRELIKQNAAVRAIVREGGKPEKIAALEQMGVEIVKADLASQPELTEACSGVSCLVSAVAGLREIIVDSQTWNFDLRKEFADKLDQSPITVTSIFNGAFADILKKN